MRKTEIMKQLADNANMAALSDLGAQIGALHRAKLTNVEELAAILKPLAQAMAALTDETRQSLAQIEAKGREQAERLHDQIEEAAKVCDAATKQVHKATDRLEKASNRIAWSHYLLAMATGCVTALLVSASWLWLAPPTVSNHIDAKEIADQLRPVIAPLKPSKGK
jgi:hypothetical protein